MPKLRALTVVSHCLGDTRALCMTHVRNPQMGSRPSAEDEIYLATDK